MNPKTKTKTPNKLSKNNSSNGSSRRFFPCCMPQAVDVTNMNDVGSVRPVRGCTDGPSEHVLTYVKAMEENKQEVVLPRMLPAAAAAAAAASLCGYDDDDKNISVKEANGLKIIKKMKKKKKKKNKGSSNTARPRLLGILKAVFFETFVAKRIRKRKNKQKMCPTNSGSSNEKSSLLKEFDQDGSITSSASAWTASSDHTNKSFLLERKQEQKRDNIVVEAQHHHQHGRGCYDPSVGLCLVLVSLLILIIWGKLCAIFCTSAWLFFGARWNIGNQSSENMPVDSRRKDC